MTVEDRIEGLIEQMTLEEKVSMCVGVDNWHTQRIERLGIPALRMTDGPHGARTVSDDDPALTYPATCFPTGSALAATWNTELMERVGAALAAETRERGSHILLGPAVNIHRHPLNGRNFEYYSEDPHLAGRMAIAWINGLQRHNIGASLKHFACNNSEFERFTISAQVDERALHEIYYPAFKAAVREAQPWTVMSSYNRINGVSSAHNKPMLKDMLKDEWGFSGFVVSDWGGVYDRVAAANAGCDVEMPFKGAFQQKEILAAVRSGAVSLATIDDKVRRVLRILFRAGLFDTKEPRRAATVATPASSPHRALAREAACEAMALLKNTRNLLPFDVKTLKSVAVIGPAAATAYIQGGGSAYVTAFHAVTPLDAITRRCGDTVKVSYEFGCSVDGSYPPLTLDFSAEYFDNPALSGAPVATRAEKMITLSKATLPASSGSGLPVPALAEKDFSVRWKTTFVPRHDGVHRFSLSSHGASRLTLGGKTIIDNWTPNYPPAFTPPMPPVTMKTCAVTLKAGEKTTLTVEFSRADEANYSIHVGCAGPAQDPIGRAVALAEASDVAIVCIALPACYESEGYDRPDMELTGDQALLIKRVAAANRRTVVVVMTGSPITMSGWIGRTPAVLQAWYGGQETGDAVAAILFGDVSPSGRLPMTMPRRLQDMPAYTNYPGENAEVRYGEGIFVGYRYFDKTGVQPLFPFGHGLSYTQFAYGRLRLSARRIASGQTITASVAVTNTGVRAGKEVVQLYVGDPVCTHVRPPRELKAFQKVELAAGETKTVTFTLAEHDLAFYDPLRKAWVAEPGTFTLMAGSSSRAIRARARFTFTGESASPSLSGRSRLADILAHPQGRAIMRKHLGDLRRHQRLHWIASYTLDQVTRLAPEAISPQMAQAIATELAAIR